MKKSWIFHLMKTAFISSKKPPGQRISLLNVSSRRILVEHVCSIVVY